MNLLKYITLFALFSTILLFAEDQKVLVEIFTNSHCPICPPAHSALDSYLQTDNSNKIEFIYYHMAFPYSSDGLYQHNTVDASAKNNFYGPHSSTPKTFFNGTLVGNSYNNWASSLNNLTSEQSDFSLNLSGKFSADNFTIYSEVTLSSNIAYSDLSINYVVVEDVFYLGSNGISNHKNVMREIVNVEGEEFSIAANNTVNLSETINFNGTWNSDNIKVVVFIQNQSTKEIFQSASISYSDLVLTDVSNIKTISNKFKLYQNYPNPFNPTTTINYTIASNINNVNENVQLVVYDVLGKEIAVLVNESQSAGEYEVDFDAENISGGFYFYQLKVGNYNETRKMILLK